MRATRCRRRAGGPRRRCVPRRCRHVAGRACW
jgi:hypothetical protein